MNPDDPRNVSARTECFAYMREKCGVPMMHDAVYASYLDEIREVVPVVMHDIIAQLERDVGGSGGAGKHAAGACGEGGGDGNPRLRKKPKSDDGVDGVDGVVSLS